MAVATAVLISAIGVLSVGVEHADEPLTQAEANAWRLAAGVAGACLSGFAYAVLSVVIRRCVTTATPMSTTMFVTTLTGAVSLGAVSWVKLGPAELLATPPPDLTMMLLAGFWNAVAFVMLTKALQLTSVVYVNALNASQVAMAGLAGIFVFQERLTLPLILGVLLTATGLVLMRKPRRPTGAVTPRKRGSVVASER
jgi:drug/metabolite transporter (DMT)-like permease